jgi:tRNA-specific 2-thiouridylase
MDDLLADGVAVDDITFVSGMPPENPEVEVKVRYRSRPVPATLSATGAGEWAVRFEERQPAAAPGQFAVFYRGDEVLGGGTIRSVIRSDRRPGDSDGRLAAGKPGGSQAADG